MMGDHRVSLKITIEMHGKKKKKLCLIIVSY